MIRVPSRYQFINVFWVGANARSSNGTDLSCQCIKLVSKRQLDAALQQELTFADHVHEFDAGQDISGCPKGLEVEHRFGDSLYCPAVLLNDVV